MCCASNAAFASRLACIALAAGLCSLEACSADDRARSGSGRLQPSDAGQSQDAALDARNLDAESGNADRAASDASAAYAFELRTTLSFAASALLIGDVTGDARADLIGVHPQLLLFTQQSNGTLSDASTLLDQDVESAILVDANQDGLLDVVFATAHGIGTLPAQNQGAFGAAIMSPGPTGSGALHASDIDRDGHIDIVSPLNGPDNYAVAYLGDGQGRFVPMLLLPEAAPTSPFGALEVADVTGDARADLVLFRHDGVGSIEVYAHDGVRGFAAQPARYAIGNDQTLSANLTLGDIDDDGRNDVLLSAELGLPGIAVLAQTPDGTLERRGAVATGTGVGPVAVLDLDHDGHNEVVALLPNSARVRVYERTPGSYKLTAQTPLVGVTGILPSMAVGDLDSDGCADLAVASAKQISLLYGLACAADSGP
jgi:hypothetical protein